MRSNRNLLLVIALATVAIAGPVLAEQQADYPLPCDGSTVTKADVDRAHTVFLSGKQYLEEANYDKAISYFKDAYSIDCSVHGMLPIIATAYERKGDKGEAVRALEEYVKRAPSALDHDVIERRIRNLKDQLTREQATAAPPTPSATAMVAIAPPTPPPAASAPTGPAAVASSGPSSAFPRAAQGHSVAPWVVTGVGAAAVLAGVALYAAGAGDVSNAEKNCPPPQRICTGSTAKTSQERGNQGRSLENVGGPLLGVGAAALAAGLLWHFLERPADNASASPAASTSVRPVVAPGYAGLAAGGRF